MKVLLRLGVMIGLLMFAACPPAHAAPPPDPDDLLLRLADLPAGYVVGDDSGCGFLVGAEEAPPELDAIDRAYENVGCAIELDRDWEPRGVAPGPQEVDATVFALAAPAGAVAAFDARLALIEHHFGDRPARLTPIPVPVPLGDAAAAYETADASVNGLPRRPGVVIVWRSGALLAVLHLGGRRALEDPGASFALATAQQARMAAPTPLRPGENDDLLVPLDDPELPVAIHWLGRRFAPSGGLDPIRLTEVHTRFAPLDPVEWRVQLRYAGRGERVDLGLWTPARFAGFRRSGYGRKYFRPCVAVERLGLRGRVARIRTDRCGAGRPRFRFATVTLDDTVVTLQLPGPVATRRPRAAGYDGRDGLVAMLRGLVRRR